MRLTASDSARSRCSRACSAASRGSDVAALVCHGWAAIAAQATQKTSTAAPSAYRRATWLVIEAASLALCAVGHAFVLVLPASAVDCDDAWRRPHVRDPLGRLLGRRRACRERGRKGGEPGGLLRERLSQGCFRAVERGGAARDHRRRRRRGCRPRVTELNAL